MLLKFWVIVNALDCFLTDSVDDHFTPAFNDAWVFDDEDEAIVEVSRVNLDIAKYNANLMPWQNKKQFVSLSKYIKEV